jgi:hypothetical protein
MSTMTVFYKKLHSPDAKAHNPYLSTLACLTQADAAQMKTLASSLMWQDWGAPVPASKVS